MLFSILIPVFNREACLHRCLDSIFVQQSFDDYEVIVVDDGSHDNSPAIVESYAKRYPQLRLYRHKLNQGVGPARRTALDRATGDWIILLDSDDELAPQGLSLIAERLRTLQPHIAAVNFSCQMDSGEITPDVTEAVEWSYYGFLRFMESQYGRPAERFHCYRADTVQGLSFPTDNELEERFNLDFHRKYTVLFYPEVMRLYHQDAANQLSKRVLQDPTLEPDLAQARSSGFTTIMTDHGAALRRYAPRIYFEYLTRLCVLEFTVGRRRLGIAYSVKALLFRPFQVRAWGVLITGCLGRGVLLSVRRLLIRVRNASA